MDNLSYLKYSNKLFVMDRLNGRWAFVPASEEPFLKLLGTVKSDIPPTVASRVQRLESALSEVGLGEYIAPSDGQLNTVIVKLTNACNYGCKYCYDFEPSETSENLNEDLAVKAILESMQATSKTLHVILHGGEPTLMFGRIKNIVRRANEEAKRLSRKVVFSGQTNLSLLNDDIIEFSQEHAIAWGISLDGPSELNDRFRVDHKARGTYRYFKMAYAKYPNFVKNCGVLTTITSSNHARLHEVAAHFRDLGLSSWDWTLFQPIGRGRDHIDEIAFSVDTLIKSWNELFDAVLDGKFEGFPVRPVLSYLNNFVDGPGGNMCMRRECGAARDLLSISVDGTVEACDCIDPTGPLSGLGKIRLNGRNSIVEARSSERANFIRSRDTRKGGCDKCIWLSVCGGTCAAHADGIHGIWDAQCAVAMNAFERISSSLAENRRLLIYKDSCKSRNNG